MRKRHVILMDLVLFFQAKTMLLPKEQLQHLIKMGKLKLLSSKPPASHPVTMRRAATTCGTTLSIQPTQVNQHQPQPAMPPQVIQHQQQPAMSDLFSTTALSPSPTPSTQIIPPTEVHCQEQLSNQSQEANWPLPLAQRLIDIVVRKSGVEHKSKKFWNEVASELGEMTARQCRNKYFNTNKTRTKKRRECGSGKEPINFTVIEKYLDEELPRMKNPTEIPDSEVITCSSSILPEVTSADESAENFVETCVEKYNEGPSTPQTAVGTPYRKKPKRTHGSGSRQATTRNSLQQIWVMFLKDSDERRSRRLETEVKKLALREENVQLRKERNATKREKLKFEKAKFEHKKSRERKKDEQWRKLLEIQEEKLKALKELKDVSEGEDMM